MERLICTRKKIGNRRGNPFAYLSFQRVNGGPGIRLVVAEADAVGITVGGYYWRAIVPDTEPLPQVPTFKPGDQILNLVKWAGLTVTYPATVVRLKGKQSVWIRSWRSGMESYVRLAHIVPAPEPFPDPQDFSVIMPGDSVYWRGEWAMVVWLAPPDGVVISIPVPEWKWKKWWKEGRKERDEGPPIPRVRPVKLKELTPAPPRPEESLHPLLALIFRESLAAETA